MVSDFFITTTKGAVHNHGARYGNHIFCSVRIKAKTHTHTHTHTHTRGGGYLMNP